MTGHLLPSEQIVIHNIYKSLKKDLIICPPSLLGNKSTVCRFQNQSDRERQRLIELNAMEQTINEGFDEIAAAEKELAGTMAL